MGQNMDHRGDRADLRAARLARDPAGRGLRFEVFRWQQVPRDAGRDAGQGMEPGRTGWCWVCLEGPQAGKKLG